MKKCPGCGEEVVDVARFCSRCRYSFPEVIIEDKANEKKTEKQKKSASYVKKTVIICVIVILLAIAVFFAYYFFTADFIADGGFTESIIDEYLFGNDNMEFEDQTEMEAYLENTGLWYNEQVKSDGTTEYNFYHFVDDECRFITFSLPKDSDTVDLLTEMLYEMIITDNEAPATAVEFILGLPEGESVNRSSVAIEYDIEDSCVRSGTGLLAWEFLKDGIMIHGNAEYKSFLKSAEDFLMSFNEAISLAQTQVEEKKREAFEIFLAVYPGGNFRMSELLENVFTSYTVEITPDEGSDSTFIVTVSGTYCPNAVDIPEYTEYGELHASVDLNNPEGIKCFDSDAVLSAFNVYSTLKTDWGALWYSGGW